MTAHTLNSMGVIYSAVLQLSEARAYVREAEEIGTRLNNLDVVRKSTAFADDR
jgi:hypothetical protein